MAPTCPGATKPGLWSLAACRLILLFLKCPNAPCFDECPPYNGQGKRSNRNCQALRAMFQNWTRFQKWGFASLMLKKRALQSKSNGFPVYADSSARNVDLKCPAPQKSEQGLWPNSAHTHPNKAARNGVTLAAAKVTWCVQSSAALEFRRTPQGLHDHAFGRTSFVSPVPRLNRDM